MHSNTKVHKRTLAGQSGELLQFLTKLAALSNLHCTTHKFQNQSKYISLPIGSEIKISAFTGNSTSSTFPLIT